MFCPCLDKGHCKIDNAAVTNIEVCQEPFDQCPLKTQFSYPDRKNTYTFERIRELESQLEHSEVEAAVMRDALEQWQTFSLLYPRDETSIQCNLGLTKKALNGTAGTAMLRVVETARGHFEGSGYCPTANDCRLCQDCIHVNCERRQLGIALGGVI